MWTVLFACWCLYVPVHFVYLAKLHIIFKLVHFLCSGLKKVWAVFLSLPHCVRAFLSVSRNYWIFHPRRHHPYTEDNYSGRFPGESSRHRSGASLSHSCLVCDDIAWWPPESRFWDLPVCDYRGMVALRKLSLRLVCLWLSWHGGTVQVGLSGVLW